MLELTLQALVARAIVAHQVLRRAADEPFAAFGDPHPLTVQSGAHRAGEPLCQIIEPLNLLLQAHARVREPQPSRGRFEARALGAQLAAHTRLEALGGTGEGCEPGDALGYHELGRT